MHNLYLSLLIIIHSYNFINLCYHKSDFGVKAEWHFFGTGHGKSPCDGIGGTVKRIITKTSLQRPSNHQILTPQEMFYEASNSITGIKYVKITFTLLCIGSFT